MAPRTSGAVGRRNAIDKTGKRKQDTIHGDKDTLSCCDWPAPPPLR
jgi:hypothetical protein